MKTWRLRANATLRASAIVGSALLAGCATTGNPKDPLEGFNRAMYSFNDGVDSAILRPVASGYDAALPNPVKTAIGNFFGNVADLWIGINNFLQGKPTDGIADLGRFGINSTVGIVGLIDIATPAGIPKHNEDFGQTLGRWGVGTGAYVVWPLVGPRTMRDTAGFIVDTAVDPIANIGHVPTRNSAYALRLIDNRADLLPADKLVEEAALDKYAYVRDAYLQRRRNLIHDGNPPRGEGDK